MENQTVEPEIKSMINEVNSVLEKHLCSLLEPIIKEKNITKNILLNIPFVKYLYNENKRKDQLINNLSKQLENFGKGSIRLEVSDIESNINTVIENLDEKISTKNKKINSVSIFNNIDLNDDSDDSYNYSSENSDVTGSPEITTLLENLKKAKENYEINEIKLNDSKEIKKIKILNEANDPIVNQFKLFTSEKDDTIKTHSTTYVEGVLKLQENTISNTNSNIGNDKEVTQKETEEEVVVNEDEDEEEEVDEDENEEDNEDENEEDNEDDEEEDEVEEDEEEEELEVDEVEIDGVLYLTNNDQNGKIYKCDEEGEIIIDDDDNFIIVGKFQEGEAIFI